MFVLKTTVCKYVMPTKEIEPASWKLHLLCFFFTGMLSQQVCWVPETQLCNKAEVIQAKGMVKPCLGT